MNLQVVFAHSAQQPVVSVVQLNEVGKF